jgi:hypothetical protein
VQQNRDNKRRGLGATRGTRIAARLNVEARYLPGDTFRKLFDADSIDNAEAIKRAGLAANK